MPHDRLNMPLKDGDRVLVECEVVACTNSGEDGCNLQLRVAAQPQGSNYHPCVAANAKQVLLPSRSAARLLYEGYCKSSGCRSLVSGDPLPDWSGLRPDIQAAWLAAVGALMESAVVG